MLPAVALTILSRAHAAAGFTASASASCFAASESRRAAGAAAAAIRRYASGQEAPGGGSRRWGGRGGGGDLDAHPSGSGATDSNTELSWETFDFSSNPKQDLRFGVGAGGTGANIAAGGKDDYRGDGDGGLAAAAAAEADLDRATADQLRELTEAYLSLPPELVARATEALEPHVNEGRRERIEAALGQRTRRSRFLFENPSNPSNVWACLRTIDSFGVQHVDVVIDSGMYEGKMSINSKAGMRTAMGSAKWLTLRNHPTTAEAVRTIKNEGYLIYASDLSPTSKDVRDVDWDAGPICVVMGNEERGISDGMRDLADVTFTLPMCGFAESFNLSVATSITLAHMSAQSDNRHRDVDGNDEGAGLTGPLRPGDLTEHQLACLKLKGLLQSLPQRRMGGSLLKRQGIVLPEKIIAML
jgi:tRNA (guanosine-2'-O-)-methyltransferase